MGNCFGVGGGSRRCTDIRNDPAQSTLINDAINPNNYYELTEIAIPVQFKPGQSFPTQCQQQTQTNHNHADNQNHLRSSHHLLASKLEKISVPWTTPVPITRMELDRKREEFWETAPAYGGNVNVWQTLREVISVGQDDIETAQAILTCAGIQVIDGNLMESFDDRGFLYQIPPYCLCLPTSGILETHDHIESNIKSVVESSSKLESVIVRLSNGEDLELQVDHDMSVTQIKDFIRPKMDSKRLEIFWAGMGPLEDNIKLSQLYATDQHVAIKLQCWIF